MRLSVIVPLLNEEDNLRPLHQRLSEAISRIGCDAQLIFIDDGSRDRSAEVITELAKADPRVQGILFSRNFGHEAASTAGFDLADGDAVVLMDADLQDPPEMVEQMVALWREGNHIVYARRARRRGESAFKRFTSWLFYRVLQWLSDVEIPRDVGDFRLVDRRVVEAVRRCREQDRFMRGLVAWTGFKSTAIEYDRPERAGGETKYNTLKLLWLSLDAAVGFSVLPLRLASAFGFLVMFGSLIMVAILISQKLLQRIDIPGYALQTAGLFFLGGVQMLLLGVLGEYVGRIYRQVQARPIYVVREMIHSGAQDK
jgi:glycosyltransferase involved in cell wall biosynthesis